MESKPGFLFYAVPGQRKSMIAAAEELDRRGFPFIYCNHGSARVLPAGQEAKQSGVVRTYIGTAVTDGLSHCLAIAMRTKQITIGTGIEVTYTRHPVEMLGVANYINEVSDGRFILGIGPGHNEILTQWNYPIEKPLAHMRRYAQELREVATGQPIPAVIFSVLRNGMLRLAGELADGAIWANAVLSYLPTALKEVPAEKRDSFIVANLAPCYVSEDRAEALAAVRVALTNYLTLTNYQRYFTEAGYGKEVEQAKAAIATNDHAAIAAAVSERMADDICLYGSAADVREKFEAFQAAGVNQMCVSTLFHSDDQAEAILRVADAFD